MIKKIDKIKKREKYYIIFDKLFTIIDMIFGTGHYYQFGKKDISKKTKKKIVIKKFKKFVIIYKIGHSGCRGEAPAIKPRRATSKHILHLQLIVNIHISSDGSRTVAHII